MAIIDYAVLDTDGIRMDLMIEAEVRALLHDSASIRKSGALLFAGDVAGIGSDVIAMRYSSLDGYTPMAATADGTEIANSNLTNATANITVARQGLRYALTDLASILPSLNLTGDPKLTEVSNALLTQLRYLDPEKIRNSESHRKDVVSKAKDVADKLSGFFD